MYIYIYMSLGFHSRCYLDDSITSSCTAYCDVLVPVFCRNMLSSSSGGKGGGRRGAQLGSGGCQIVGRRKCDICVGRFLGCWANQNYRKGR